MTVELPHNLEAEQAVLGAGMVNRDALSRVAHWLQPEWFYLDRHAGIFRTMLAIHQTGETANIKTLTIALKGAQQLNNLTSVEYLAGLSDYAFSWQIEEYAREVERCAVLRQLVQAGGQIARLGYTYDLSVDEAIGSAQQTLSAVTLRSGETGLISFETLADRQYEWLRAGVVPGISTGFRDLDELTGGLHATDLILLAARPSVGKTALALGLGYNIAHSGEYDVLIFSLEMSKDQLMQRAAAMQANIDLMRLRMMRLNPTDQDAYMSALGTLAGLPVAVDDTAAATAAAIRAKASRHQAERGRPLVIIIDYIQLMGTPGFKASDRVAAVSSISRDLKALAKELDCPVFALSQLSRAVESRQSHVPMLSDLRDSGSLEQDADIVLFLYREELYDPESDQKGVAQLHIAKHRNGPIGVVPLRFDAATTRFSDLTYRTVEGY